LKSIGVKNDLIMMTGGLALDEGLCEAMREQLAKMRGVDATVINNPNSIYAGAIGAALWGAFRFNKLAQAGTMLKAS
jgi:benzoyl-CoA reductase subunit D